MDDIISRIESIKKEIVNKRYASDIDISNAVTMINYLLDNAVRVYNAINDIKNSIDPVDEESGKKKIAFIKVKNLVGKTAELLTEAKRILQSIQ